VPLRQACQTLALTGQVQQSSYWRPGLVIEVRSLFGLSIQVGRVHGCVQNQLLLRGILRE